MMFLPFSNVFDFSIIITIISLKYEKNLYFEIALKNV